MPVVPKAAWYGWVLLSLAAFGALEYRALVNGQNGDTLSATWWELRTHLGPRLLVFPPLFWLLWHLFAPWDKRTGGRDDFVVVVLGVAVSIGARYKLRTGA